jgi:hypothetical protein
VFVKVGGRYSVAVAVQVVVGVAVKNDGVKLKVGDGSAGVRLIIGVSDSVAVGVVGGGLTITATHPRQ